MWIKFRHRVVFAILRPIFYIYLRIRYGFKAYKYKLPKGPHVILFNHPTNMDPFMVALSFKGPIYFMANEDIFVKPFWSRIMQYLVAPIKKRKSERDIQAVKDSIKIIREGGNIAIAPEGNRNYSGKLNYIDPAIVKLIRLLKVPVVLYGIYGGFGVHPRFATKLRRGKMIGRVERVITPDEIKQLNNDELLELIRSTLTIEDAKLGFEYRDRKLAEHLESAFYICPKCKSLDSLYSMGNKLTCKQCDLNVTYTPKLAFHSKTKEFTFKTVSEFYTFQENFIRNADKSIIEYNDNRIKLFVTRKNRRKRILSGSSSMNSERIIIHGNGKEIVFPLEDIISMSIVYQNMLIINTKDDYYHLVGDNKFNALKMLHLFYKVKNEEKGEANEFLGI